VREDFDDFQGTAISEAPMPGELNGARWSIVDGAVEQPKAARRLLAGALDAKGIPPRINLSKPGIYALHFPNRVALGIKPASVNTSVTFRADLDWGPGAHTTCTAFVRYQAAAWQNGTSAIAHFAWSEDGQQYQPAPEADAEWVNATPNNNWSTFEFRRASLSLKKCGSGKQTVWLRWTVPRDAAPSNLSVVALADVIVAVSQPKTIVLTEVHGVSAAEEGFLKRLLQYYIGEYAKDTYHVATCDDVNTQERIAGKINEEHGGGGEREEVLKRVSLSCGTPPIAEYYFAQLSINFDARSQSRGVILSIRNVDDREQAPKSATYAEQPHQALPWSALVEEVVRRTVGVRPIPAAQLNVPGATSPGRVRVDARAVDARSNKQSIPWRAYYCDSLNECRRYGRELQAYWECKKTAALAPTSVALPPRCELPSHGLGVLPSSQNMLREAKRNADESTTLLKGDGKGNTDETDKKPGQADEDEPHKHGDNPTTRQSTTDGSQNSEASVPKSRPHTDKPELDAIFGMLSRRFVDLDETNSDFHASLPGYYLVVTNTKGDVSGDVKEVYVAPSRNQAGFSVGGGAVREVGQATWQPQISAQLVYRRGLAPAGSRIEPLIGLSAVGAYAKERFNLFFSPTVGIAIPYLFGLALDLNVDPGLLIRAKDNDVFRFGLGFSEGIYYDPGIGGGDHVWLFGIEGGPLVIFAPTRIESWSANLRTLWRF
jgi:hypothetical protein